MEHSFLYHSFGVDRNYQYHATEYKDNAIILKLKSISLKKVNALIVVGIMSSNMV